VKASIAHVPSGKGLGASIGANIGRIPAHGGTDPNSPTGGKGPGASVGASVDRMPANGGTDFQGGAGGTIEIGGRHR
jgi:hypothetical protein